LYNSKIATLVLTQSRRLPRGASLAESRARHKYGLNMPL